VHFNLFFWYHSIVIFVVMGIRQNTTYDLSEL
jgi:hypothetical protein